MDQDQSTHRLQRHRCSPPLGVDGITVRLHRAGGVLELVYALDGSLEGLDLPALRAVRPGRELWRQSCFELFVMAAGGPGYSEYNFAPDGAWSRMQFSGYRQRDSRETPPQAAIEMTQQRDARRLQQCVRLPAALLPPTAGRLALSAVIAAADGTLAYWALSHPAAQPDFHHPDAFAISR